MRCKRCGSENVAVQAVQAGAKTATKGTGALWGLGRAMLIICTCGLWLLVGKRQATNKTRFKTSAVAVCQNCGRSWEV